MPRGGFYRSGLPAEMTTKPITKANKPLANSRQQAPVVVSSNFFLMTCWSVPIMFHLELPCILI
jgi:hypothetical protein